MATTNAQLRKVNVAGELYHWAVTLTPGTKRENPAIQRDFDEIVSGRAYEILQAGRESVGDHNEMGEGAKSYGGLKECGCKVLGRSPENNSRDIFEKEVIERVWGLAGFYDPIQVTAFATGLLFGEFVLLSKIIKEFSEKNINKKIVFSLIDYTYDVLDDDFVKTHASNEHVRGWKRNIDSAVKQLLETVQSIVDLESVKFSSSIELRFFKSAEDYMGVCELKPEYMHDLLVGADIGDTKGVIRQLERVGKSSISAVFLERTKVEGGMVIPRLRFINSAAKIEFFQRI